MAADFWRVPVSVVKKGGAGSVIQDNGMLQRAQTASSNGQYLFSETGAGVQALALIGLWHEVLNFLAKRPGCGIDNQIADLPEIHMGICYYRPGQRFTGLFPVHDALRDVGSQAVGLAGGGIGNVLPNVSHAVRVGASAATSLIGGIKDAKDALQPVLGGKPKPPNMKLASNELFIKFSYLPEAGMKQIGTRRIGFDRLHAIVRETLSAKA
jgi:hypothetical protein